MSDEQERKRAGNKTKTYIDNQLAAALAKAMQRLAQIEARAAAAERTIQDRLLTLDELIKKLEELKATMEALEARVEAQLKKHEEEIESFDEMDVVGDADLPDLADMTAPTPSNSVELEELKEAIGKLQTDIAFYKDHIRDLASKEQLTADIRAAVEPQVQELGSLSRNVAEVSGSVTQLKEQLRSISRTPARSATPEAMRDPRHFWASNYKEPTRELIREEFAQLSRRGAGGQGAAAEAPARTSRSVFADNDSFE